MKLNRLARWFDVTSDDDGYCVWCKREVLVWTKPPPGELPLLRERRDLHADDCRFRLAFAALSDAEAELAEAREQGARAERERLRERARVMFHERRKWTREQYVASYSLLADYDEPTDAS